MINKKFNSKGFTLIEVIVGLAIGVIVSTAAYSVYKNQQDVYSVQENINNMQQNARMALDIMGREIRMAGYNPTQTINVANITSSSSSSISFQIDRDGNGDALGVDENITYTFINNELRRTTTNPATTEVIVRNIQSFSLTYYLLSDADGVSSVNYGSGKDDNCDGTIDEASEMLMMPGPANNCIAEIVSGPLISADRNFIRVVQIDMVVRSKKQYSTYTNPYGYGKYRTVQMRTKIRPRNMGL